MSIKFSTQNIETSREARNDDAFRELQVAIFKVALLDYKDACRALKRYKRRLLDGERMTDREYIDIGTRKFLMNEVENFAESEWGKAISPFSEPQKNMFQQGLEYTKGKLGCNNLFAEEGTWQSRLREQQRARNIPQRQTAKAIDMNATEYGKVLAGYRDVSFPQLMMICQHLDISPVFIIFGTHKETYYNWLSSQIERRKEQHDKVSSNCKRQRGRRERLEGRNDRP